MTMDECISWLSKHRQELPAIMDNYAHELGLSNDAIGRKIGVSEAAVRSWRSRENPRFPKSDAILSNLIKHIQPIIERQSLLTRDPKPQTPAPSPDMAAAIARTTQACLDAGRPINRDEAELLCSVGIHFHTYGNEPLTPQIIDALLLMIRGDQIRKELKEHHEKAHQGGLPPNNRGPRQ